MEWVSALVSDSVQWIVAHKDWVQAAFSGIGIVAIAAVWRWIVIRRRADKALWQPRPEVEQRNRQRMLKKVRRMWVEGVLEQSLYQVARIELGFAEAPEAINHPWKLLVQQPTRAERVLPDGTPMREVFDQFDETLLILGAPGSGKTTLLLELARDLIERAEQDRTHPIPVVFNLSSWALKRPPLATWLIDELNQRYDVSRKVAQAWIESDQVLPLLDGLDEVAREFREGCVKEINAFRDECGFLPLVVCSRSADYEALSQQLRMQGAVTIQPLVREQIEQYLASAGPALSGVSAAVRDDKTLWELLDTPLMLSILALAYQGQMESALRIKKLKGSLDERRAALFDGYIEAMFKLFPGRYRVTNLPHTTQKARHWVSWLAQVMVRRDQTVFYLENTQLEWLPSAHQLLLQRIVSWLFFSLFFSLFFWLFPEGLLGWLIVLIVGLIVGLFGGLIGGLMLNSGRGGEIDPVDATQWSLGAAREGLFFWLFGGLIMGLIVALSVGLFGGLIVGLAFVVLFMLIGGLVEEEIPVRENPNDGIRLSLRNALVSVLLVGVFGALIGGLGEKIEPIGVLHWSWGKASVGLFGGLIVGTFFGLLTGGIACIQHAILRVFLWRFDYAPLNYVRFLEHAKDLLFLRRVGGGYVFVHRMLMEHFAGLEGPVVEATNPAERG